MSDLAAALMVAIRVHAGQVDKQGEPYLLHVLRVVNALVTDREKVVAALHDVIEDGGGAGRPLVEKLPLDADQRQALALLTKDRDEAYVGYIQCLVEGEGVGGEIAREVKLADLRDNLGRIPNIEGASDGFVIHGQRADQWASLKARYEKAIETLEAA